MNASGFLLDTLGCGSLPSTLLFSALSSSSHQAKLLLTAGTQLPPIHSPSCRLSQRLLLIFTLGLRSVAESLEHLHKPTSSQPSVLENSGPPGVREVETGRKKPGKDGFLGDEIKKVLQRCPNNLEVGHSQALSLVSPLILPIYHWPSYLPSH